jgi:hypothetical protein
MGEGLRRWMIESRRGPRADGDARERVVVVGQGQGVRCMPRCAALTFDDKLATSWPDLFRPSTSVLLHALEDVDAWNKSGHDEHESRNPREAAKSRCRGPFNAKTRHA